MCRRKSRAGKKRGSHLPSQVAERAQPAVRILVDEYQDQQLCPGAVITKRFRGAVPIYPNVFMVVGDVWKYTGSVGQGWRLLWINIEKYSMTERTIEMVGVQQNFRSRGVCFD